MALALRKDRYLCVRCYVGREAHRAAGNAGAWAHLCSVCLVKYAGEAGGQVLGWYARVAEGCIYVFVGEIDDANLMPVETFDELRAACLALRRAGIESADIWQSRLTLATLRESGDPDAQETGSRLAADRGLS